MFEAKFPGECNAACGERIEVGDLIMSDPADTGAYIHEHCGAALGQNLTLSDEVKEAGLGMGVIKEAYAKPTKFQGTSLEQMGF